MDKFYLEIIEQNKRILRESNLEMNRFREALSEFKKQNADLRRWLEQQKIECNRLINKSTQPRYK